MKYFKLILILALIILLLAIFFKDADFGKVFNEIKNINPIYPLLFILGIFINMIVRSYRWGLILKQYKKKISLKTLINFTAIGFFINFLPGRVGEIARGILIARKEKINQSYGLASVIIERLIDVLMVVILFLVSLSFIRDNNTPFMMNLKKISYFMLPIIVFVFLLFYFINSKKIFSYVEKTICFLAKILPHKFREKAVNFMLNFIKGLRLNLRFVDFLKLFLSSLLVWIVLIPFYWILMKGFDINVSLFETIPFFSITVIAAAIPTPGMAGSLDAGAKLGLIALFKVTESTAVAYTLVFHFLILLLITIFGLISLWMQGLNFKMIKNIKDKKNEMPSVQ